MPQPSTLKCARRDDLERMNNTPQGSSRPSRGKLAQVLPVVVGITLAGLAVPCWKWYQWATAGETPYDSIGIDMNSFMPAPLHDWACDRIAQRFPRSIPPYGCNARKPG